MRVRMRSRVVFLGCAMCLPFAAAAADRELKYNVEYQCGTERVLVESCARDRDRPGGPATPDARNVCTVYFFDRPKTSYGGAAYEQMLRTQAEEKLRACGALASGKPPQQAATAPATAPAAKPSAVVSKAPAKADAALQYKKEYQCGGERIYVEYCRRDSDRPDTASPTQDFENYCQVYYLDRPKTRIGADAEGTELRTDLEKQLRACGALAAATVSAPAPARAPAASTAPPVAKLSASEQQAVAAYKSGAALAAAKDYDGAIEAFRKSIAIHPMAGAWNDLGNAYYALQRYAEAVAAYRQSIGLNPANSNPQAGAGMSYFAMQKYGEAIPFLREALRLDTDIAWASNMLGDSHVALKQYEQASQAYRDAIRLQPENAAFRLSLGVALWHQKQYADAAASLREAVRLDPKSSGSRNMLGNALFSLKQYPEAIQAYQAAVQMQPSNAVYRTNLGNTWRLAMQPEKALPELQEALRLDPKLDMAWNYLGLAYLDLERFGEALSAFQKAGALKPGDDAVRYNTALALADLGRLHEAAQLAQALATRGDGQARQLLDDIDRMSGKITLAVKPVRPAGLKNPKIELVWIAPGSFTMGGGFKNSLPAHPVTIAKGFYIGKYEVTQAEWQAVMGGNPSSFKNCGGRCPVEQVAWGATQVFLEFLNQGKDGYRYRLPSEAEWEYAFRAGTTGEYYAEGDIGWYGGNSGETTHPVGGKPPNGFGLFDIAGNVAEWCSDWFHDDYQGAPADGRPWLEGGEQKHRVARGGTFYAPLRSMTATSRFDYAPEAASRTVGLRVVAERVQP